MKKRLLVFSVDAMVFEDLEYLREKPNFKKYLSGGSAVERIRSFMPRDCIRLMIHEQYFYPDYHAYQSDFEYKLYMSFSLLCEKGYESKFFEELL